MRVVTISCKFRLPRLSKPIVDSGNVAALPVPSVSREKGFSDFA